MAFFLPWVRGVGIWLIVDFSFPELLGLSGVILFVVLRCLTRWVRSARDFPISKWKLRFCKQAELVHNNIGAVEVGGHFAYAQKSQRAVPHAHTSFPLAARFCELRPLQNMNRSYCGTMGRISPFCSLIVPLVCCSLHSKPPLLGNFYN